MKHLENPYVECAPAALPVFDVTVAEEQIEDLLPALENCVSTHELPSSTGHPTGDPTIYTGICGLSLAFYRLGVFRGAEGGQHFQRALNVAAMCRMTHPSSAEVSFYCGTPGALAIEAAAAHALGLGELRQSALEGILTFAEAAQAHKDDELLFGKAGFIFALLWARKHTPGANHAGFDDALRAVAEATVASGETLAAARRYAGSGWPLMWECFNSPYLGAAHGHLGILAMLYRCWPLLSARSRMLVRDTTVKLLAERFPKTGNLPIVLGDRSDDHVKWCHGAPGLPALCAAAIAAHGDTADGTLMAAASAAANVTWEQGVLLKGFGLCHGIAGNGYALLSMYRLTHDEAWLQKARAFAALCDDPKVTEAVAKQPDPQRRVLGKPDSPYSLMEGTAGLLCYLLDVAVPESSAFPGWEV